MIYRGDLNGKIDIEDIKLNGSVGDNSIELKGDIGTLNLSVEAGEDIDKQGTPSVMAITNGNSVKLVFNYLKGDKGERGEQGLKGDSIKGDKGDKGNDGYTPIKNVDYFDGQNGKDGKDGYTPKKGIDYFDGLNGKDGKTPVKGVDYFDGQKGDKGDKGDSYTITPADYKAIADLVPTDSNIKNLSQLNNDVGFITDSYHDATKQNVLTDADKQAIANLKDISGKQDKITSTNKLDYSLLSNTPTIPTQVADEHINDLIDAKIGAIEYGAY